MLSFKSINNEFFFFFKEFKSQREEQERFYATNGGFLHEYAVSIMDNHVLGHEEDNRDQITNAITANISSASDNSADNYYH